MGKLSHAQFPVDLSQYLNVELARVSAEKVFIHSPRTDSYEVRNLKGPVAWFRLTELPGCCGVLVSYHAGVVEEYRKQGWGSLLLGVRMAVARRKGYGSMTATVLNSNHEEQQILEKAGWVTAGEFRNPKTGSIVVRYHVNL